MPKSRRQLKQYAKGTLQGKFGIAVLGLIAYQGIVLLSDALTSFLFPGSAVLDVVISQIFSFILTLITGIVAAGLSYMYLNMSRGREHSIRDLFFFFKNQPDRVIIAGLVQALISVAASVPYLYVSYTTEMGTTLEQQVEWMLTTSTWMLFSLVLNVIVSIPFSMSYFLLCDDQTLKGFEAVKQSVRMMRGNMGRYLLMELSFVPLIFLSMFTLYIALIWIMPYMQMTMVMFYRDLKGEL